MTATVSKRGNSLGIRIPSDIALATGIKEGDKVEINGSPDGSIIIRKRKNDSARLKAFGALHRFTDPLSFEFDECKATQASSYLLSLNNGRMNYMKMMKILYLSDRKFILDWGNSITTDNYVSMDNGPVVSRIYDLIKESRTDTGTYWSSFIRTEGYEVVLNKDPGDEYLSPMEMEIIASINSEFRDFSELELCRFCHDNLPELHRPSVMITIEDILRAGKPENDYDSALREIQLTAEVQRNNYFMIKYRKL